MGLKRFSLGGVRTPKPENIRRIMRSTTDFACRFRRGRLKGGAALDVTTRPGRFTTIERERESVVLGHPKLSIEAFAEPNRLSLEPRGEIQLAAPTCQRRHLHARGIDVALDLRERDRWNGKPAVRVRDRVVRILPALVHQAAGAEPRVFA
jgi:hypothetical protein